MAWTGWDVEGIRVEVGWIRGRGMFSRWCTLLCSWIDSSLCFLRVQLQPKRHSRYTGDIWYGRPFSTLLSPASGQRVNQFLTATTSASTITAMEFGRFGWQLLLSPYFTFPEFSHCTLSLISLGRFWRYPSSRVLRSALLLISAPSIGVRSIGWPEALFMTFLWEQSSTRELVSLTSRCFLRSGCHGIRFWFFHPLLLPDNITFMAMFLLKLHSWSWCIGYTETVAPKVKSSSWPLGM